LYSIARTYGLTVDQLKSINILSSNNLSVGQRLRVRNSSSSPGTSNYTVKSGDTLYSIASRFNTTVDEIKRLNNLSSNLLSIGQILIVD